MLDTKYDIAECMAVFEFMGGKVYRHMIAMQNRINELVMQSETDNFEMNALQNALNSAEDRISELQMENSDLEWRISDFER